MTGTYAYKKEEQRTELFRERRYKDMLICFPVWAH